jgi:hypothetical protein
MPLSRMSVLVTQLGNIRDVADDLSREVIRMQCDPTSTAYAMIAFIKAEAETALEAIKSGVMIDPAE